MGTVQFHEKLKGKAKKLILYTPHAVRQMNSEDRMITTKDVEEIIYNGQYGLKWSNNFTKRIG